MVSTNDYLFDYLFVEHYKQLLLLASLAVATIVLLG
jgi:hypothetical protein